VKHSFFGFFRWASPHWPTTPSKTSPRPGILGRGEVPWAHPGNQALVFFGIEGCFFCQLSAKKFFLTGADLLVPGDVWLGFFSLPAPISVSSGEPPTPRPPWPVDLKLANRKKENTLICLVPGGRFPGGSGDQSWDVVTRNRGPELNNVTPDGKPRRSFNLFGLRDHSLGKFGRASNGFVFFSGKIPRLNLVVRRLRGRTAQWKKRGGPSRLSKVGGT